MRKGGHGEVGRKYNEGRKPCSEEVRTYSGKGGYVVGKGGYTQIQIIVVEVIY